MMSKRKLRVLLTGGGTGGHIYPALAVADRLKMLRPEVEFLYVGTERGLESHVVPAKGYSFEAIHIEGFSRKISFEGLKYNLKTMKLFFTSLKRAQKILRDFQPDVVVGTGGYVSAPVIYKASRMNIPTVIHEQNSVVGITNKFLARFVDKIAICFEEAQDQFGKYTEKVVLTGNPRAQEVVKDIQPGELERLGLTADQPTVLIFGGSRGASAINQAFIDAYEQFAEKDYQVLFVSGAVHYDNIQKQVNTMIKDNHNIHVFPYIENMPEVFTEIKLVVGRSGATSLAEITALGLPSILIPSPNVTADHQTKNAMSLVQNKAAKLIPEPELTGSVLVGAIDQLMSNEALRIEMAQHSKSLGRPEAADHLIEVMLSLIKQQLSEGEA